MLLLKSSLDPSAPTLPGTIEMSAPVRAEAYFISHK